MKWEEYVDSVYEMPKNDNGLEATNIECPMCGKLIFRKTDVIYTSLPPKHMYVCTECGWSGFAK